MPAEQIGEIRVIDFQVRVRFCRSGGVPTSMPV